MRLVGYWDVSLCFCTGVGFVYKPGHFCTTLDSLRFQVLTASENERTCIYFCIASVYERWISTGKEELVTTFLYCFCLRKVDFDRKRGTCDDMDTRLGRRRRRLQCGNYKNTLLCLVINRSVCEVKCLRSEAKHVLRVSCQPPWRIDRSRAQFANARHGQTLQGKGAEIRNKKGEGEASIVNG